MHKVIITLYAFFIIISAASLSALEMEFTNDALGWGFMPEWDDYETYTFNIGEEWEDWSANLSYLCFTNRAEITSDSSRIDCIQFGFERMETLAVGEKFRIDIRYGGILRSFNDYSGLEIQTGWHNYLGVDREIPTAYDDPLLQFVVPLSAGLSSKKLPWLSLDVEVQAGWPLEIKGAAELKLIMPEDFIPLEAGIGYRASIMDINSEAYSGSSGMKTGWYTGSEINFWPLFFNRVHYVDRKWGKGSIGINISEPVIKYLEDIITQLIVSGITHITFGMKINWTAFHNVIFENLSASFSFTSVSGWIDAPLVFPMGGRYSEILLGIEPYYSIMIGEFRIDPFIMLNSGIRQNRYYELMPTALTPIFTSVKLIAETGGGVRFLFPFFYERMLGFTFSCGWETPLISSAPGPEPLPAYRRLKVSLLMAVTGNNNP